VPNSQQLDLDYNESDNQAKLLDLISLLNDVLASKLPRSVFPSN